MIVQYLILWIQAFFSFYYLPFTSCFLLLNSFSIRQIIPYLRLVSHLCFPSSCL